MEELDEVEVLWPEYYTCHTHSDDDRKPLPAAAASMPMSRPSWQRRAAQSRPVDVPNRGGALLVLRWKDGTREDLEVVDRGDGGSGIIVPPHLLVSGGESATVAYASLRSGRERRRARDLRHLRNSVLRMTGFIEG
ncbi:unnamed protein product [Alopecurus aequalis]